MQFPVEETEILELARRISRGRGRRGRGIRRVRTPAGSRKYGLPIGAIITRDAELRAQRRFPNMEAPEDNDPRVSAKGGGGSRSRAAGSTDTAPERTPASAKELARKIAYDPEFTPVLVTPTGDQQVRIGQRVVNFPNGSRVFRSNKGPDANGYDYAIVRDPDYELYVTTSDGATWSLHGESENLFNERFDGIDWESNGDEDFSAEWLGDARPDTSGLDDEDDEIADADDLTQYDSVEDVPEYLSDDYIQSFVDGLARNGTDPQVAQAVENQFRELNQGIADRWNEAHNPALVDRYQQRRDLEAQRQNIDSQLADLDVNEADNEDDQSEEAVRTGRARQPEAQATDEYPPNDALNGRSRRTRSRVAAPAQPAARPARTRTRRSPRPEDLDREEEDTSEFRLREPEEVEALDRDGSDEINALEEEARQDPLGIASYGEVGNRVTVRRNRYRDTFEYGVEEGKDGSVRMVGSREEADELIQERARPAEPEAPARPETGNVVELPDGRRGIVTRPGNTDDRVFIHNGTEEELVNVSDARVVRRGEEGDEARSLVATYERNTHGNGSSVSQTFRLRSQIRDFLNDRDNDDISDDDLNAPDPDAEPDFSEMTDEDLRALRRNSDASRSQREQALREERSRATARETSETRPQASEDEADGEETAPRARRAADTPSRDEDTPTTAPRRSADGSPPEDLSDDELNDVIEDLSYAQELYGASFTSEGRERLRELQAEALRRQDTPAEPEEQPRPTLSEAIADLEAFGDIVEDPDVVNNANVGDTFFGTGPNPTPGIWEMRQNGRLRLVDGLGEIATDITPPRLSRRIRRVVVPTLNSVRAWRGNSRNTSRPNPVNRPDRLTTDPTDASSYRFSDSDLSEMDIRPLSDQFPTWAYSHTFSNSRIGDRFLGRNNDDDSLSLWSFREDGRIHSDMEYMEVSYSPEEFGDLNYYMDTFAFSGNEENSNRRVRKRPGDVATSEWGDEAPEGSAVIDGDGVLRDKTSDDRWDSGMGSTDSSRLATGDVESDDSIVVRNEAPADGRPVGATERITDQAGLDNIAPGSSAVLVYGHVKYSAERHGDGWRLTPFDGGLYVDVNNDSELLDQVQRGHDLWHVPNQNIPDAPSKRRGWAAGDEITSTADILAQKPGTRLRYNFVRPRANGDDHSTYTVLADGQIRHDGNGTLHDADRIETAVRRGQVTVMEVPERDADVPSSDYRIVENLDDYVNGDRISSHRHLRDMEPGQQVTLTVSSARNGGRAATVVLTRTNDEQDLGGFMFLAGRRGAGYNAFGENNASLYQAIHEGRLYFGDIRQLPDADDPEFMDNSWSKEANIKLWDDGPMVSEHDLRSFIDAQVYSRAMQTSYFDTDLLPLNSPFRSRALRDKLGEVAVEKYSTPGNPARVKPASIRYAAELMGLEYTEPGSALLPDDLNIEDFRTNLHIGRWYGSESRRAQARPYQNNMGPEQIEVSRADVKVALAVLDNMLERDDDTDDPDVILKRVMAMRGSPLQNLNTSLAVASYFRMERWRDGVRQGNAIGVQRDKRRNKALMRQMLLEQLEGREPGYYGIPEDEVYDRGGRTFTNTSRLARPAVNSDTETATETPDWERQLVEDARQAGPGRDIRTRTPRDEPETPETPAEPETPETPAEPETPETPAEPGAPAAPAAPPSNGNRTMSVEADFADLPEGAIIRVDSGDGDLRRFTLTLDSDARPILVPEGGSGNRILVSDAALTLFRDNDYTFHFFDDDQTAADAPEAPAQTVNISNQAALRDAPEGTDVRMTSPAGTVYRMTRFDDPEQGPSVRLEAGDEFAVDGGDIASFFQRGYTFQSGPEGTPEAPEAPATRSLTTPDSLRDLPVGTRVRMRNTDETNFDREVVREENSNGIPILRTDSGAYRIDGTFANDLFDMHYTFEATEVPATTERVSVTTAAELRDLPDGTRVTVTRDGEVRETVRTTRDGMPTLQIEGETDRAYRLDSFLGDDLFRLGYTFEADRPISDPRFQPGGTFTGSEIRDVPAGSHIRGASGVEYEVTADGNIRGLSGTQVVHSFGPVENLNANFTFLGSSVSRESSAPSGGSLRVGQMVRTNALVSSVPEGHWVRWGSGGLWQRRGHRLVSETGRRRSIYSAPGNTRFVYAGETPREAGAPPASVRRPRVDAPASGTWERVSDDIIREYDSPRPLPVVHFNEDNSDPIDSYLETPEGRSDLEQALAQTLRDAGEANPSVSISSDYGGLNIRYTTSRGTTRLNRAFRGGGRLENVQANSSGGYMAETQQQLFAFYRQHGITEIETHGLSGAGWNGGHTWIRRGLRPDPRQEGSNFAEFQQHAAKLESVVQRIQSGSHPEYSEFLDESQALASQMRELISEWYRLPQSERNDRMYELQRALTYLGEVRDSTGATRRNPPSIGWRLMGDTSRGASFGRSFWYYGVIDLDTYFE